MRDNRLRENRVRETNRLEQQERSGMLFGGSVLGTLAIGVIVAIIGIYYLRPLPAVQAAVQSPPEIRYVDREVPAPPVAPAATEPLWKPEPKQPEPARIETVPMWVGVWRPSVLRPKKAVLPIIELGINGALIVGKYARPGRQCIRSKVPPSSARA
jgi:hypothetical protein